MRWKRYPEYRPSGVEWLDKIPAHWATWRFKFLLSEPLKYGANEVAELDDPALPRYIRITDVTEDGSLRDETFKSIPEDVARPYLLSEGDLLFARSGATVGKTFLYQDSWGRAAYAGYLIRARMNQRKMLSRLAAHFSRSTNYWDWLRSNVIQATIQNVSAEKYAGLFLSVPPIEEQENILKFLDRETARIDALIEKKQRQIELLQEKRAALISHAVTKGLDPNAKMKDSGIEWLGRVPGHWDVFSLRRVANRIQTGSTPPTAQEHYYEGGSVPWYGPGSFGVDLVLGEPVKFIAQDAVKDGVARLFKSGSAMIVTIGATIGKVGYIKRDASCNQQITVVTFDMRKALGKFGAYQLKRLEPVLRGIAPSTTLPIMNQQQVGDLPVALPSLKEQEHIVAYIDEQACTLDALVRKVDESIAMLREYRTALISAAVTGKIDVRQNH